jgi:hypothetical protein
MNFYGVYETLYYWFPHTALATIPVAIQTKQAKTAPSFITPGVFPISSLLLVCNNCYIAIKPVQFSAIKTLGD